jgi:O-acetyl-ADP-ribose deacetylase (regulator of RNase III)
MATKKEKTTKINYIKGDATQPVGDGIKVIVHVCNNIGAWGAGFVLALSKRWVYPEQQYLEMKHRDLGSIDLVQVQDDIIVCNLIGQEGTAKKGVIRKLPPVRYVAIEKGLNELVAINALRHPEDKFTVHMPMIGSGLAGGNWLIIERIIEVTLCAAGIPVTVYKLD